MANRAKEVLYENLDTIYAARLIHYENLNESGSPIGTPWNSEFELFVKGEREGTYVQLGHPYGCYYEVNYMRSNPTAVNSASKYTLRELIEDFEAKRNAHKEKEAIINQEGFGKVRGQLNNLDTILNLFKKGRTR